MKTATRNLRLLLISMVGLTGCSHSATPRVVDAPPKSQLVELDAGDLTDIYLTAAMMTELRMLARR